MRITARQLRQIIREELHRGMREAEGDETGAGAVKLPGEGTWQDPGTGKIYTAKDRYLVKPILINKSDGGRVEQWADAPAKLLTAVNMDTYAVVRKLVLDFASKLESGAPPRGFDEMSVFDFDRLKDYFGANDQELIIAAGKAEFQPDARVWLVGGWDGTGEWGHGIGKLASKIIIDAGRSGVRNELQSFSQTAANIKQNLGRSAKRLMPELYPDGDWASGNSKVSR